MDRGVIYVATGPKFVAECIRSVRSLRRHAPQLLVTIFTDLPEEFGEFAADPHLTRTVLEGARRSFADKTLALQRSPYEQTLFLDADTVVCRDPEEVFGLLEKFDIAAALESYQPRPLDGVAEAFPEFNAGVILFRRSPAMEDFLRGWHSCYEEHLKLPAPIKGEQPAFREVLYHSALRFAPLPVAYNFHAEHPVILPAGAVVAIFHGRRSAAKLPCDLLKRFNESRVFLPGSTCLKPARITSLGVTSRLFLVVAALPVRLLLFLLQRVQSLLGRC